MIQPCDGQGDCYENCEHWYGFEGDCFDLQDWIIENYPIVYDATRYMPLLDAVGVWQIVYGKHTGALKQ